MIEIIPHGNGWGWQMIAACGRVLVAAAETFPCEFKANGAAKAYRAAFFFAAAEIDCEQYSR